MKHLLFVFALLLGVVPAQQRERAGRGQRPPQAELQARLEAAQQRLLELQQRIEQRRAELDGEVRGRDQDRRPEQRGERRRGPAQGRGAMRHHRGPARPMLRAAMLHRLHQHPRLPLQPGSGREFLHGRGAPVHGRGEGMRREGMRREGDRGQRGRGNGQQRRPAPPDQRGHGGGDV